MSDDNRFPAPFDRTNFIFPGEWQSLSDLLSGGDIGLLFLQNDHILHANAHLCDRLGFNEEELVGRPVESLFPSGKDSGAPPANPPVHGQALRLVGKNGTPVAFHLIMNRVDTLSNAGWTVWVLQPAGHRLTEEMYTSEGIQAQAIMDYLPDLVCICDPDTTLTYASRSLYSALGYGDGLEGQQLTSLVHADDRARLIAILQPLVDAELGACSEQFIVRVRRPDGAWKHVSAQARNLTAHHAVSGLLINGRDVTEEQLRRQGIAAEKKRQLHYLNRLLRMAQRPHANLGSALTVILKSCTRALGIHRSGYWEVTEDPAASRCVLAYDDVRQNFFEEAPDRTFAQTFHPLLYRISLGKETLVVNDVDQDPRTAPYCEYFQAAGIKGAMIVPVHGEKPVGLLTLFHYREARRWRKDEADLAGNVAHLIGLIMMEVERTKAAAQLRHVAHHDNLTGLPNRQFLFEHANDILPELSGGAATLAAFFIGLDGFKNVNDTLGQVIGDELLKAAALRLRNVVRKNDVLVRLGGDEFLLLARHLTDMRIADDVARQIVETLRNPFCLQGRDAHITASVGIALYPEDGTDIETLMKKADIAMYQAKSSGRNQYQMFAPRLNEGMTDRHTLETELRRAVEERELQHYYQPQIDLRSGKVRCVEALLRWHHPRHGVLLPASFLPAAEETGLINTISAWVLDDACQQMRAWQNGGLDGFNIAINFSSSQLMDRSLLTALERTLERTGILAHQLEWEVKESTVMQHNSVASATLSQLSEMHIGLSIDDFGTGYTNMAYLRQYPVHKVKIDASFINGLFTDRDKRAITDSIISMAQPLGLDVVAEGVETPQQMEYLRDHGCDIGQGYFFTKPLTVGQFQKWLIRH
jgi:diguanylate cyclase (GGDEF)-like protein/PAS domain S-box-containing protein